MAETEKINLYLAIERMKEITSEGGTFSLKFRKYNKQTRSGGDLAVISQAKLRPKSSDDEIRNASHKLFFTDVETGLARNCWQILIMEFNGKKISL